MVIRSMIKYAVLCPWAHFQQQKKAVYFLRVQKSSQHPLSTCDPLLHVESDFLTYVGVLYIYYVLNLLFSLANLSYIYLIISQKNLEGRGQFVSPPLSYSDNVLHLLKYLA